MQVMAQHRGTSETMSIAGRLVVVVRRSSVVASSVVACSFVACSVVARATCVVGGAEAADVDRAVSVLRGCGRYPWHLLSVRNDRMSLALSQRVQRHHAGAGRRRDQISLVDRRWSAAVVTKGEIRRWPRRGMKPAEYRASEMKTTTPVTMIVCEAVKVALAKQKKKEIEKRQQQHQQHQQQQQQPPPPQHHRLYEMAQQQRRSQQQREYPLQDLQLQGMAIWSPEELAQPRQPKAMVLRDTPNEQSWRADWAKCLSAR